MVFSSLYYFFHAMFFLFTWIIPIFALWAKWFEPIDSRETTQSLRSPSLLSLHSHSRSESRSHDDTSEDEDPDESDPSSRPVEYPYTELFGFTQKQPIFNVDRSGGDPTHSNFIQTPFYRYLTYAVYFYRLPLIITFLGLGSRVSTRKGLFNSSTVNHPVQRGRTLFLEKFWPIPLSIRNFCISGASTQPNVSAFPTASRLTPPEPPDLSAHQHHRSRVPNSHQHSLGAHLVSQPYI